MRIARDCLAVDLAYKPFAPLRSLSVRLAAYSVLIFAFQWPSVSAPMARSSALRCIPNCRVIRISTMAFTTG